MRNKLGKPVDVAKVIELYGQGLSMNAIARQLGHDHSVIGYHLYRNHIPIRSQGESQMRPISTEYLARRYNEGVSLPELSREVGLSDQAIYQRLIKASIKIRTISEAVKLAYATGKIKALRGPNSRMWRGGRYKDSSGYVIITSEGKKRLEHHLVWEQVHGKIPEGWIIHHMNGKRDDNRLENLTALPRKRHSPMLVIQPYRERILELEAQLRKDINN